MHKKSKIIGIDIGGTKMHMGVVQAGKVIKEVKISTSANAPKEQILSDIDRAIEQLMEIDIIGIGIGVPGLVDEKLGIVHNVQNIPNWRKVPLKDHLQKQFGKPVFITNDANIFVAGIKMYGPGNEFNNLVGITLGTGMGTGIIIDNVIYSGQYSSAGEYGGMPYLDKTLEDYCSGKFFQQKFGISGQKAMVLAEEGNTQALEIFQQYGHHLGNAIKIILYSLSPQAIFLGGSVSKCYNYFKEAMLNSIGEFPYRLITENVAIEQSKMANAAILGSAAIFQMRFKENSLVKPIL